MPLCPAHLVQVCVGPRCSTSAPPLLHPSPTSHLPPPRPAASSFVGLRHDYLCVSPASASLTHTLDPSLTGNGHFALPISLHHLPPSPSSSPSTSPFTHPEQVTDHFQHLESDEAITLSLLWSPPVALVPLAPCSSLEWTFLCYRHSSRRRPRGGGSHHSDGAVIPRLASTTPDSRTTLDLSVNQKKNRLYFPSSRVRSAAIGAIWAALCYHPYTPHPCGGGKKMEAESGGAAEAALARACVHLRAALLTERSHPSSVSMLCLFPPSSQSLHALLLIIGPTGTVGRVCVCVCTRL